MNVINKKIIGFDIKADDFSATASTDSSIHEQISMPTMEIEHMHENVGRPEMLVGATYKVKSPMFENSMFITINDIILNPDTEHELRRPYEIFINSKNMDHFQWVVALTRVISAVFRKGGDINFLVDELKAVFDPKGGYFKTGGRYMPSLVAEIGDVIETHLKTIGLLRDEVVHPEVRKILDQKCEQYMTKEGDTSCSNSGFPNSASLCEKCHFKAVIQMDGCLTCLNCADSKCG